MLLEKIIRRKEKEKNNIKLFYIFIKYNKKSKPLNLVQCSRA